MSEGSDQSAKRLCAKEMDKKSVGDTGKECISNLDESKKAGPSATHTTLAEYFRRNMKTEESKTKEDFP